MSYCPKCGNKVEENMTFCPRCGAPLKVEAPVQAAPALAPQRREKAEKGEKGEYGFIGWLVGGLVLIIIGFFAVLRISGYLATGMDTALIFLIIGVIIIIAALYFATMARKRSPPPPPPAPAPV
jgi:predicted lipid-binding transport protein (Tim44 family)